MDKLFTYNFHKYTALRLVSGTLLMATSILVLQVDSKRSLAESFTVFCDPDTTTLGYVMHVAGLVMFCAALPLLSNSYVRKVNSVLVIVLVIFILLSLMSGNFVDLIAGILLLQLNIWLTLLGKTRKKNARASGIKSKS